MKRLLLVSAALAITGCGDNLQRPAHSVGGTIVGSVAGG